MRTSTQRLWTPFSFKGGKKLHQTSTNALLLEKQRLPPSDTQMSIVTVLRRRSEVNLAEPAPCPSHLALRGCSCHRMG